MLSILWFGGEPLLAIEKIELLSKYFIRLCADKNITYNAAISTNGYSLNKDIARKLKACEVNQVSLTIDGIKDVHDRRRPLIGGGGTFDAIINNITEICDIIPIDIRVNIDYENCERLEETTSMLRNRGLLDSENVRIFLTHVQDFNNTYEPDKCLSDEKYSKLQLKLLQEYRMPLNEIYPYPRACFCQADHSNCWCIDSLGNFYKYLSDIGIEERKIMSLKDDGITNTSLLHSYMLFDATEDPVCQLCKYLPICMGGCPHFRMQKADSCDYRKYAFEEYLKESAKIFLKELPKKLP